MTRGTQIAKEALIAAKDFQAAKDCLCDGSYLSDAGYTDTDQTDIECALDLLKDPCTLLSDIADLRCHDQEKIVYDLDGIKFEFSAE